MTQRPKEGRESCFPVILKFCPPVPGELLNCAFLWDETQGHQGQLSEAAESKAAVVDRLPALDAYQYSDCWQNESRRPFPPWGLIVRSLLAA